MKRYLLTIITLAVCLCYTAKAQKYITVDGVQRNYLEYVPKNLGTNRPLLISCHGMNQDAAYQKGMLKIETVADTAKFVTVFPNGINKGWDLSGDKDLNFVKALIDKMVTDYSIDRNKVYLSGFSMGGMFTYFAMNKMADKIAAFAPISGYPMYGGTFTSSRPIPIIHTHGTSDDVVSFNNVQSNLNGWIDRNKCDKTAKVIKAYRGYNHVTRHEWNNGLSGTRVVLMELAGKGHFISNDGLLTGDEIWKFCKSYSLNAPTVSFINYKEGDTFDITPEYPSLTLKVNAKSPNGAITNIEFFDNNVLKGAITAPPYSFSFDNPRLGKHTYMVRITDEKGTKAIARINITVTNTTGIYTITEDEEDYANSTYNALGQRIYPSAPGIIIHKGKKVFK